MLPNSVVVDTKLHNLRPLAVWSSGLCPAVAQSVLPYDDCAMRPSFSALPLLFFACACGATSVASEGFLRVSEGRRSEVRDAVAAHRAAQREEQRRGEALAGRRLTAGELFGLRQQVRGQWVPAGTGVLLNSAESQPAERIVPVPQPVASPQTAPRSLRH